MQNLESMTKEELLAQIAALQAAAKSKATLKITDKGGLSVYGLGRFPITLYRSQWEKLISMVDDIKAFIKANENKLPLEKAA